MGVPLHNLRAHGHWKSDAIWAYLKHNPKPDQGVADTFQNNITSMLLPLRIFGLVLRIHLTVITEWVLVYVKVLNSHIRFAWLFCFGHIKFAVSSVCGSIGLWPFIAEFRKLNLYY